MLSVLESMQFNITVDEIQNLHGLGNQKREARKVGLLSEWICEVK
jgi:hypothetical protein